MMQFMDPASGVFGDEAFHQLLTREASRATRYQDFFSLCLVRPDVADGADDAIHEAVARKIAAFLRSTDVVGRIRDGIAILMLNTPDADSVRIAERIRAHVEAAAFKAGPGTMPRSVTVSIGLVSFPRDGSNGTILLSKAQNHLRDAVKRGGNRVVGAGEHVT